ncbi:MAG: hypothetical protein V4671_03250 [Armatimonadota bacterium]
MRQRTRDALKAVGAAIGILVIPALFSPMGMAAARWLQTAPRTSSVEIPVFVIDLVVHLGVFLLLGGVILALAAPVTILLFLIRRKRELAALSLGIWMMSWASFAAIPISNLWASRRAALVRIAENAKPVTTALEMYRLNHGSYPKSLQELVPAYLPSHPRPDALGCPVYYYQLPGTSSQATFDGYELKLKTPNGGVNWDCFVFWPEKNYPRRMYGGSVERIGDWAYVHE